MARKKGKRFAQEGTKSTVIKTYENDDEDMLNLSDEDFGETDEIDDVEFEKEYRKKYKNEFLNKYIDDFDEDEYDDDVEIKKTTKKKIKNSGNDKGKKEKDKDKKKKKKKKSKHIFRKILLVLLLLLLCGIGYFVYKTYQNGGGVSGALQTVLGHNEQTKKNLESFNCLLLGVSTDLDSTLTDTIMICSYNPNSQKATLFSIQRDTFVGTSRANATSGDKINAVYSYAGAEGTLKAVNNLTGLDLKYYAVVKTEALIELVDEIGGVDFNVPINMKYDDVTQDLHINLRAGEQHLDGDHAEQLLRFRHNNDGSSYPSEYGDQDVGRMRTQREFIAETLRQTCTVGNILKIGKIIDVAKKNIETNVDLDVLKDYIPYVIEFKTENLQSASLPGQSEFFANLWFYTPNKKETSNLIKKLFVLRDMTDEEIAEFEQKNNVTLTSEAMVPSDVTISVQNGTESTELLNTVVENLKAKGYKVQTEKKSTTTNTTTICNRNFVDENLVEDIKNIVGTGVISNNSSNSKNVDVYIVLGTDCMK